MVKKIKGWVSKQIRKRFPETTKPMGEQALFTPEIVERAYNLGYNDGRRDGLAIAREQATKALGEILWEQNQENRQ